MAKTTKRTAPKARTTKKPVAETVEEKLARLTAGWAAAFDALVASRVAFQALCDEVSAAAYATPGKGKALEARRDRAEAQWRAAEEAESAAAAAFLGVWTGGAGDADVLRDESEVDVDPAAALAFWKRVAWESYLGWAAARLGR